VNFNLEPVTRKMSRTLLQTKKQSPHIWFGAGLVGVIVSAVLACRATTQLESVLDDAINDQQNLDTIKKEIEEGTSAYPVQQYRKDMIYVHSKVAFRITKLYGPSVGLGALSIVALAGSHIQLTRRNTALMAAYAAVQKAYVDYRNRVRAEYGEEKELDIYRGVKKEIVSDEDGSKVVKVVDPNGRSPYARCFDIGATRCWQGDAELNMMFIKCQQKWANDKLQAYGHVFLNEVYDRLGFDDSTPGAVVGWLKNGDGDGVIDFGMFDAVNRNPEFISGNDPVTWLDFNVDGVIYDLI
jgi:Family of unknown function (DUF6353)